MFSIILQLFLTALLILLPSCGGTTIVKKKVVIKMCKSYSIEDVENPPAHPLSVWIHGTTGWGSLSDMIHAVKEPGLYHASFVPCHYHLSNVTRALAEKDPVRFPYETFYVFGWSGKLDFKERHRAAQNLYKALVELSQKHTHNQIKPEINIITHSHGGNVLLNLALAQDTQHELKISRAILLACPVQHATKHLIEHKIFEKAYSFYSSADILQIIDPQGMYRNPDCPECRRHFEFSNRTFDTYPNLRQMKLKINGHGILHSGFLTTSFVKMIPNLIDIADEWEAEQPSQQGQERILSIKKR